ALNEACRVELYSDSKYLIDGMTKWINGWIKNKWTNAEKKPVKNKELWIRLLSLSMYHKISWNWIAGHSGDKFNERADQLARSQCKN
ncbi:MAG: ribonuclease HI, partial [Holosporaceae bacterium]|nr:ribonuclease HI [Holosporaceae bacterium]